MRLGDIEEGQDRTFCGWSGSRCLGPGVPSSQQIRVAGRGRYFAGLGWNVPWERAAPCVRLTVRVDHGLQMAPTHCPHTDTCHMGAGGTEDGSASTDQPPLLTGCGCFMPLKGPRGWVSGWESSQDNAPCPLPAEACTLNSRSTRRTQDLRPPSPDLTELKGGHQRHLILWVGRPCSPTATHPAAGSRCCRPAAGRYGWRGRMQAERPESLS